MGSKRICSRNPKLVHYCSHCGGKHAVSECTQLKDSKKQKQPWGNAGWIQNKKGKWIQG